MKKIILLSVTLISLLLIASCNREDINLQPDVVQGEHELDAITCTLDGSSKTSLEKDGTVFWRTNDRIAVIGTNGIKQYILKTGAGTPIGRFIPLKDKATYSSVNDLTAIYPAVAVVNQNTLRINTDIDPSIAVSEYGISWIPFIATFAFTNNDIKVAKPALSSENAVGLNFKFTQLATWVKFKFDFTGANLYDSEYSRGEQVKSIHIKTSNNKGISGLATLDNNSVSSGSNSEILREWTKNFPDLSNIESYEFMMYPVVKVGDVLEITLETDVRTLKFYGKVQKDFRPGTILEFNIQVDQNFIENSPTSDRHYTSTLKPELPFYYYGNANCLLLPPGTNSGQLNIAAYQTNRYFEQTNQPAPTTVPRASYAELIWEETPGFITNLSINSDILTVTKADGVYSNALVGIYDASNKLLWSYHIWAPEDNPTTLEYPKTISGDTYKVLEIPLGGMIKVTPTTPVSLRLKNAGFYYQWGRKDPLGRIRAADGTFLPVYDKNGNEFSLNDNAHKTDIDGVLSNYDPTTDGLMSHYMIKYTLENPTIFLKRHVVYSYSEWHGETNKYLWGNSFRLNSYPKLSDTYKSIFDPSPAGYRVAPEDLGINFSTTYGSANEAKYYNALGNENFDWISSPIVQDRGIFFYYQDQGKGPVHYYVAAGVRGLSSGDIYSPAIVAYFYKNLSGYRIRFDHQTIHPLAQTAENVGTDACLVFSVASN